ncbi:hypothetical protein CTN02_21915 [Lysinibacillus sphaericus]|nr:hypothetical protein CTN02_21915 [Lysinibacillus sphaericus]
MITEHNFLTVVIAVYMLVNLYTDIRYLKTKNLWHVLILIVLFTISIIKGAVFNSVIALSVAFLAGIVLRKILSTYGAGDVKMIAILFMAISLFKESKLSHLYGFLLIYIVISFLHIAVLRGVRKISKRDSKLGGYTLRADYIVVPEAVPLSIATFILLSIYHLNIN